MGMDHANQCCERIIQLCIEFKSLKGNWYTVHVSMQPCVQSSSQDHLFERLETVILEGKGILDIQGNTWEFGFPAFSWLLFPAASWLEPCCFIDGWWLWHGGLTIWAPVPSAAASVGASLNCSAVSDVAVGCSSASAGDAFCKSQTAWMRSMFRTCFRRFLLAGVDGLLSLVCTAIVVNITRQKHEYW